MVRYIVYKEVTSIVTKKQFWGKLGTDSSSLKKWVVSLIYDGIFFTNCLMCSSTKLLIFSV